VYRGDTGLGAFGVCGGQSPSNEISRAPSLLAGSCLHERWKLRLSGRRSVGNWRSVGSGAVK